MLERGVVFWLSALAETLYRRVGGSSAEGRPLLAGPSAEGLARIKALLAQRAEAYAQAHHIIETDHLTPEQTAQRVLDLCGMG